MKVIIFFIILANANLLYAKSFVLDGRIKQEKLNIKEYYDALVFNKVQNILINDSEGDVLYNNVKKIQLNYTDNKFNINYKKNAKVVCADLYSADSMFHYTNLICIVDKITYIK